MARPMDGPADSGAAPRASTQAAPARPELLTVLALVGATAGWGVGATMTRLAVGELAPIATTCLRFGTGALLLVGLLSWRGEIRRLPALRDWPLLLLLGGLGVTGFGALFTVGLQWTGPTEGTLIQGTTPLMTLVLAAAVAGESVRRRQVLGGLLAFVGLAVLLFGSGQASGPAGEPATGGDRLFGNLVLLAAALCWTGYNVAVRLTAHRLDLGPASAFALLAGTVLLLPLAWFETPRGPISQVSASAWLAMAYLCVVSTCLAYVWWNHGIRRLGAGRAATFSFVGPLASMVSAIPLLGEWPSPAQLVGGALILSGLFAANRS